MIIMLQAQPDYDDHDDNHDDNHDAHDDLADDDNYDGDGGRRARLEAT